GGAGPSHERAARDPLPLPRNLMVVVAFAQGLVLLLLWRALTHETWPSQTPALNLPLWTLAVTGPTLFLLTVEADNLKRAALFVTAFSAVLALLAIYVGWQASPINAFPTGALFAAFVLTMLVACFKGAMYLQQFAARERIHYPALFSRSWRNFGVFGLSWTLTGGVALVLALWGALFAVIGIDFFQELFREDWFLFPVLTVAFGLGVFIFRRLTRVIDGVTSLLEGLMRLLLPLTAAVVAIFLAALPFTGLAPLWETGNGTALLMALNAITLFTVNAVYQTDRHAPYPLFVHRPLYVCVALLPVVSALSVYGLSLRVAQYGWTVERCWALTLAVLFAAFSLGYTWSIVRHRDRWPAALGRVNVVMGWVVLGTMLLVNTPLLDFRKISLASQFGRVEAGEIELRDFDFRYAREQLARPGWLRLEALAEEHGADPELMALIRPVPPGTPGERIWESVTLRPEPFEVPAGLRAIAEREWYVDHGTTIVLVRIDMDGDGQAEYAMLNAEAGRDYTWGTLFRQAGEEWVRFSLDPSGEAAPDVDATLLHGAIGTAEPALPDLRVGELIYRPAPIDMGDGAAGATIVYSAAGSADPADDEAEADDSAP
ncbi:MAG: DUF4153 domain-containing protein, partial [Gammaproteobacteria bacterium]|nr:DUF4153 domain-containing protein [Gammaproteobacteria bacterium]